MKPFRDQRDQHHSGFTLIELMIVMAVIALISIIAVPSISSQFRVSLGSATREVASVVREAYNTTLITGKLHRVVYDLKSGEYWVEVGPNVATLETKESRERAERRRRLRFGEKKADETGPTFTLDKTVTLKKRSLPRGVSFEDVITEQTKEPQTAETTRTAYTHIFPNGMTEQTLIHIKDSSKHQTSLSITPILGQSDVYESYVKPEEVFGK